VTRADPPAFAPAGNRAAGRVVAEIEDGVGLITFDHPERQNALTVAMWEALGRTLESWRDDPALRVVVLTGCGSRAFSAGADLGAAGDARDNGEAWQQYDRLTQAPRQLLAKFPRPVIARIRGCCLGIGLAVALQADLRIAGKDSEFGVPAVRLGMGCGPALVRQLVDLVGPAQARMLLLTGTRIDAAEAVRIGLVNQVVADEELSDTVVDLARTIADNAPLAVRAVRLAIDRATGDPAARDDEAVDGAIRDCFASDDYREGHAAALEQRPPRFRGR